MIEYTIENHSDSLSVAGLYQFLQVIQTSEAGIDLLIIDRIVFVRGCRIEDGIQIDRIRSNRLDMLYICEDAPQGATMTGG